MKYILKKEYSLCGWKDVECGLKNNRNGNVKFISPKDFQHLLFCNGNIDLDSLPEINKEILAHYVTLGVIESLNSESYYARPDKYYKKYPNRFVQCVQWSITGKCNYKCRHCYMDAPSSQSVELSLNDLKKILNEIEKCGIYHIKITGGEPLIRKDFFELIKEIINKGIIIDEIYTNGYLINRAFLQKLSENNVFPVINMSFDGVGYHDWMRRVEGAEKNVIRAFKLCHEMGFRTKAEMCIHKGNINSIQETVKLLSALHVEQLKIGPVFNTPLWLSNCEENNLELMEYYEGCISYISQFFKDKKPLSLSIGNLFIYNKESDRYYIPSEVEFEASECSKRYLCKSARNTAYIAPNGTLLPCMVATSLPINYISKFPNLLEHKLTDVLQKSNYLTFIDMRVNDLFKNNSKCNACNYRYKCHGGCRVQAMLDHIGNWWACDNLSCDYYEKGVNKKLFQRIKGDGLDENFG